MRNMGLQQLLQLLVFLQIIVYCSGYSWIEVRVNINGEKGRDPPDSVCLTHIQSHFTPHDNTFIQHVFAPFYECKSMAGGLLSVLTGIANNDTAQSQSLPLHGALRPFP
jgi:hypothetical protein